ncbi:MAG: GNAT family N-acetyltransferase [Gammaproteobacteria bacterium]|nr:GNAT family N-acetyltransferase [Gammaproteobacteria bacterium]MBT8443838.1 GNAT family N-acetyltransferase [Gammaproteobacteria bacterium]NND35521.1 GNAT family N-acetyltransferase [Gammaproteobacteria bacterium]
MTGAAPIPIELRRLSGSPDDADVVQRIYAATPAYSRITTGTSSRPGSALQTFGMLPDGCAADAKHMYLVCHEDQPVGFVDVIRGYPAKDCAYIGLFVLIESQHGRGIGTRAFRNLETLIDAWRDIRRIRLTVIEANVPALGFWEAMGFARTGEYAPYESGTVRSRHILFEKHLETRE